MRLSLLARVTPFVLALGCGEVAVTDAGSDSASRDAPPDVAVVCTGSGFQSPVPIAELNTPADERGLRLTVDELTAVFSRAAVDAGRVSDGLLTTRASVMAPFASPVLQTSTVHQCFYPSLSGDGVFLFDECLGYGCYMSGPALESWLCLSDQSDGTPFRTDGCAVIDLSFGGGPSLALGPFGPHAGAGPFSEGDGFLTVDAGSYYFMNLDSVEGGLPPTDAAAWTDSVWMSHAAVPPNVALSMPYPLVFTSAAEVTVPHDPSLFLDDVVVSADERTLLVSVRSSALDPVRHIAYATRASAGDAFGPLQPLHELDSPEGEYPSWMSADGCRLYLSRKVNGQWDLYKTSRSP